MVFSRPIQKYAVVAAGVLLLAGCMTVPPGERAGAAPGTSQAGVVQATQTVAGTSLASGEYTIPERPPREFTVDERAQLIEKLEFAFEYAVDYGVLCATTQIVENPKEEARQNPLENGLKQAFNEGLEWGLRHMLDEELQDAPADLVQAARQKAFTYARTEGLGRSIDDSLAQTPEDKREALKNTLTAAFDQLLEPAFEVALGRAQREPLPVMAGGKMGFPVAAAGASISSYFGSSRRRAGGQGHIHTGVDILAPKSTPIVASADGTVTFAAESGNGYGRLIKLDHGGGIETWYAHCNELMVHTGDTVATGQQIGGVGATGRATANHLHYEVRENGRPVNPLPYLGM